MSETESTELKVYEITNRETGEKSHQAASNAEDACKQAGWLIGNCYVVLAIHHRTLDSQNEPVVLVRISCQVCPYQWAECKKPPRRICPCRREMPDLNEWLAEITKAHLCEFVGEELTKTDYRQFQKWTPIAQAIKELSPQH